MKTFEILKQETKIEFCDKKLEIRVRNAAECIDSFVSRFREMNLGVYITAGFYEGEICICITIDDFISETISRENCDFIEICKLSDRFMISGINYAGDPEMDEEQTGVIITVMIQTAA